MREYTILIVDDEPAIRTYLATILQRQGLHTIEAENAIQALQMVQRLSDRLGLIITDIRMPGDMDGMDLAYSIRNSFPTLPVILVSGYADKTPCEFPFVQKPFKAEELLAAIDKITDTAQRDIPKGILAAH